MQEVDAKTVNAAGTSFANWVRLELQNINQNFLLEMVDI